MRENIEPPDDASGGFFLRALSCYQLLSFTTTGAVNFTVSLAFGVFGALGALGGGGGGGGATGFSLSIFTSSVASRSAGGGGGGGGGGGSGAIISTGGVGGGGGGICFELFWANNCNVVKHTASTRIIFFILVIFST